MQKELHQFLNYCETDRKCALSTLAQYQDKLSFFLAWAEVHRVASFKKLRARHVQRYAKFLAKKQHGSSLAATTQNTYLSSLRQFIAYTKQRGYTTLSPQDIPRQTQAQRAISPLTARELSALCVPETSLTLRTARDQALIELLAATGMRVAEICALNWQHVCLDVSDPYLHLPGYDQHLLLSHQASFWLKKYHLLRTDSLEAVFLSFDRAHQPRRLSVRSVERIVAKRGKKAQLAQRVTPTLLRQTAIFTRRDGATNL